MKRLRMSVIVLVSLLGSALSGCQPNSGPLPTESPATAAKAAAGTPSSSEFGAVIQAAVEDRNGTVLDTPPAPRLPDGQTTPAYRAKRVRDLPVVARSKAGFKSHGFWYTSFSTTVTVESVHVDGPAASVHFKEMTAQYQASAAHGPSDVPESYSLPQTATFKATAEGWQLDSITPSLHDGGLPMSVVDGCCP
jgi:hypothetical protein